MPARGPHPLDFEIADNPDPVCMHLTSRVHSVILTCGIDVETAQTLSGQVWHLSGSPPSRTRAENALSGVREGDLFEKHGMGSRIPHLRRQMTAEEIKRVGSIDNDRHQKT